MELEVNQAPGVAAGRDEHATEPASADRAAPRTAQAQMPVPAPAIPTNAIRIYPVDGVVQLPAGTRLDAISVSGANLVGTLPNGQVLVIIDGALHIPQIVLGPIHVSAANIAALIAGQEPEPAAGAPQSSGGDFAEAIGDIGDSVLAGLKPKRSSRQQSTSSPKFYWSRPISPLAARLHS
jgi:hypothetical protein